MNTVNSYTAPVTKFLSDNAEPILTSAVFAGYAAAIGGLGYFLYQAGYTGPMLKAAYAYLLFNFYKEYPNYSAARLAIDDAFGN